MYGCTVKGGPAIADNQNWLRRVTYILEKLGKKPTPLGQHPRNEEGTPMVFGEFTGKLKEKELI